jgi:P27 family predicted phage terminase small subunit
MRKRKARAPEELNGDSLLAWDMFDGGTVEAQDRPAMILLCQSWAEMVGADRHVEKNGTVIKLPNGYPGPNPFCKVRNEARAVVMRLLREFGRTPASRAKIGEAEVEESAELEF